MRWTVVSYLRVWSISGRVCQAREVFRFWRVVCGCVGVGVGLPGGVGLFF